MEIGIETTNEKVWKWRRKHWGRRNKSKHLHECGGRGELGAHSAISPLSLLVCCFIIATIYDVDPVKRKLIHDLALARKFLLIFDDDGTNAHLAEL